MTDATAVRTERRAISAFSFERAVREFFSGRRGRGGDRLCQGEEFAFAAGAARKEKIA